jgi:flagellar FliL protein
MAKEEDKTVVHTDDPVNDSNDKSKPGKAGGFKKLLLLGSIGAGVIVLGVALAVFVIKPMTSGSGAGGGEQAGTTQAESSKHDTQGKPEQHKPKKKKRSSHEEVSSGIYAIKDIVINPASTGGTRFLSVSFAFELESEELKAEFETREAVIRDALITILSSKTVVQLTDPKQKEIVRYQIKKRVSDLMKTDELAGVYYTDFVLQ